MSFVERVWKEMALRCRLLADCFFGVEIEIKLMAEWSNGLGNLHGAAAAWLVDM